MTDVQDFLASENIRLRNYTVGAHKTTCPSCSHIRKKRSDPCLSVTISAGDDAVFHCHNCGHSGGSPRSNVRAFRERTVTYRKPERVVDAQRPDRLITYFAKRGISQQVVERAGIYKTRHYFPQISAEVECIAFPYEFEGSLRNVKYRDAAKNFAQEKGAEPVFYNADSIAIGADLIIVEGEIDVLSMLEAGFAAVVSLANGAPAKPETSDLRYAPLQTHADALEKVGRVLIATDMDVPGENLAAELARRLGKDRCWRVRFPDAGDVQTKDANECLVNHGAQVLRECVETAEPWPIEGLHSVDDFAEDVLKAFRGEGPQPLSTGFPEFDKAFKILPGQFVALTGIPNHGKSRFLDQTAIQMSMAHGWHWAIFSPETGSANHLADLCEIHAGQPFHAGPSRRMSEGDLRQSLAWVRERFVFIDAKEHSPSIDWILERARASVLRYGTRALIIDPYNEVEASRPPQMSETEFVSQLISKCKRFAQTHDVTVFMVIHPTKINTPPGDTKEVMPGLYDMAGSAHWRNKADAALVVYRDFDEGRTIVAAKKIRRQPVCGSPGAVEFVFLGHDRRFEAVPGSYKPLGRSSAENTSAPRRRPHAV
jgi:twinkle protein